MYRALSELEFSHSFCNFFCKVSSFQIKYSFVEFSLYPRQEVVKCGDCSRYDVVECLRERFSTCIDCCHVLQVEPFADLSRDDDLFPDGVAEGEMGIGEYDRQRDSGKAAACAQIKNLERSSQSIWTLTSHTVVYVRHLCLEICGDAEGVKYMVSVQFIDIFS